MKVASGNRAKAGSKTKVWRTGSVCLDLAGTRSTWLLNFSESRLEIDNGRLFLGAWLSIEGAVVRLLQL